jgi:hypothetical protein
MHAKLRAVRHERTAFEPRFFERHPDFWPIARAACTFADRDRWPDVAEYVTAFAAGRGPVVFEAASPKRRRAVRRVGPVARAELYDAVIVKRGVVPTRAGMWHDFLNALVWATFPRAKLALHRRQHEAIERWVPDGAMQLPNARTPELDTLALLDEGGVLVLDAGGRPASELVADRRAWIYFGHALYEGLVFERAAMISRALVLDARGRSSPSVFRSEGTLALADELLAEALSDPSRVVSSTELPRLPLTADVWFRPAGARNAG